MVLAINGQWNKYNSGKNYRGKGTPIVGVADREDLLRMWDSHQDLNEFQEGVVGKQKKESSSPDTEIAWDVWVQGEGQCARTE